VTLKLELSAELENRLKRAARASGMNEAEFALHALHARLNGSDNDEDRRAAVLQMLREWEAEDAAMSPAEIEQSKREWEAFKAGINENQSSGRTIFP
jgi:hypothetical protein